jgi:SAM-dependent methyltransferase
VSQTRERAALLAIALGSAGVVGYQIALMRLFSFAQWYHFASLMVSLALLGFAGSGTVLTWGRRFWEKDAEQASGTALLIGGISMPAVTALLGWGPLRFDLYLLFVEAREVWKLFLSGILLFVPFLASATGIGGLLSSAAERSAHRYGASLLGAAVGGFGLLAGATFLTPARMTVAAGLLTLLGAAGLFRRRRVPALLFALLVVGGIWIPALPPSQFKDLSQVEAFPEARTLAVESGIEGMVHVLDAPALHSAPGLSLQYTGEIPRGPSLFVDAALYGTLHPVPEKDDEIWEEATTEALPYWLRAGSQRVLLLGLEGGAPLRLAYQQGATTIAAVDPHPAVSRRLEEIWRAVPEVSVDFHVAALRVALMREPEGAWDLIRFPTVGAFHGGEGLQALGVEFLLTTDAIQTAWQRLAPQGLLVVSAWMDYPERKPLRLLNLLHRSARELGIEDPTAHLAIVRGWGMLTIVLRKEPLSATDGAQVLAGCTQWGFDPLCLGPFRDFDRQQYHVLEEPVLFDLSDAILRNETATVAAYPFALDPPTDARPFFSQFLRWRSHEILIGDRAVALLPFFELGSLFLLIATGLFIVLGAGLVLLALRAMPSGTPGKRSTALYFGSLGLGFMAVEIVLMHLYHLIWGDPILAAGGTIGGILLFSGLGSLASGRCASGRTSITVLAGVLALLLLAAAFFLFPLARTLGELPAAVRYPLSLLLLAVLSFPLGGMFPLGFRSLQQRQPALLGWAWGVNGATSVVGAPLVLLLALGWGFDGVLLLAALAYTVAGGVAAKSM